MIDTVWLPVVALDALDWLADMAMDFSASGLKSFIGFAISNLFLWATMS